MIGITTSELRERLVSGHEVEFTYEGLTYVIQPEVTNGQPQLSIWDCSNANGKCICSYPIPEKGDIPTEVIDTVLNSKCFDGKSFFDIGEAVTVEVIY